VKKSDINTMPQFFDRFTSLVTDVKLREELVWTPSRELMTLIGKYRQTAMRAL
jgi:hypothetical protein